MSGRATNRATGFEVDTGNILGLQDMSGHGGSLNASAATPETKPNTMTPATTISTWAPK